jgi:fibronectin type 3 domain-containing protein
MSATFRAGTAVLALTALSLTAFALVRVSGRTAAPPPQALALQALGQQPLSFEVNEGQTDRRVRFLSRGSGYTLFLTGSEAVLRLPTRGSDRKGAPSGSSVVRMQLQGANRTAQARPERELATQSHYLLGNDPARWRTGVRHYAQARYEQVYPGVDLVYYGNQRQLEYDFVVAPGADPGRIRLRFQGAERVEVSPEGDLLLHTAEGTLKQHRPVVYQEQGGRRTPVAGRYLLALATPGASPTVGFDVPQYDPHLPLVIDPVLSYASYLGGPGDDYGTGITLDGEGVAWITGYTTSVSFPASGATTGSYRGSTDAFVARVDGTGALLSVTYLGGSGADRAHRICAGMGGEAYVVGETSSPNFPTVNPFQGTFAGVIDAFLVKLTNSGAALAYSTYLGGQQDDRGNDLCVDAEGIAYVTGLTTSTDFPITGGALKPALQGTGSDAFVTAFGAAGNGLVYSTYLGGTGDELANGIAVDGNGSVFVTGDTSSSDFPTTPGAFQRTPGGGLYDVFLTRLNPGGASLAFSTFVGGNGVDRGAALAVDGVGNCYLTGFTNSTSFPTVNAPQPVMGGGSGDAFVTMMNSTGTGAIYSTYLGGSNRDNGQSIAVEPDGTAAVVGLTDSVNFPRTAGGPLGSTDAFVARIAPGGVQLSYSASLGGAGSDLGLGVVADNAGGLYLTGATDSANFSPTGIYGGGEKDAFVVRLGSQPLPAPSNLQLTVVSASQIDLTWSDNSSNEDSFTIERREGSGAFNVVGAAGANQTAYSDTGLSAQTTYTYRVRAASADSTSAPSNEATAATPAGLAAPSNLRTTSVTRTQLNLAWNDNSTGESGFRLERSTNGGLSFSTLTTVGANVTAYPDSGLTGGTTYTYRVRAVGPSGASPASNELSASTLPDPPGTPVNLAAVADASGVVLTWADGSFNETGFKLERATGAGGFSQIRTTGANVLTVTDTTAALGTQYRYRVRATNAGGDSDYSNVVTITTASATPSAPTGLAVTVLSDVQLRLDWTDTSSNESGFRIERKTGAGSFAEVGQTAANTTTYTDRGLTASTTYTYQVRAANAAGFSGYTAEVSGTTLQSLPPAPTGPTVDVLSRTELKLTWEYGPGDPSTFRIERKSGAQGFTVVNTAAGDQRTWTNTGLQANTTYTYRVRAHNAAGDSAYTDEVAATTLANPPATPTLLTATPVSRTSIVVSWIDRSVDETGFKIERKTGSGEFALAGTAPTNAVEFTDTGLTGETTYTYRVRATNSGGDSAPSAELSGTTRLNPPSDLTVTTVSFSQLRLNWSDHSGGEKAYVIERATASGSFTQVGHTDPNVTTYLDGNLAAETTYQYRVSASDGLRNTEYAGPASGTTLVAPPAAPRSLQATLQADRSVLLQWTDTSSNETAFVVERKTAGGEFVAIHTTGAGTSTYTDTGLAADTSYTYQVKATNAGGSSNYSNPASITTLPDPPAAPGDLTATRDSAGAHLVWSDHSNNETAFQIERATDGVTFTPLASVGANVTTYLDAALQPVTTYTYRVKATNAGGDSDYSSNAAVTTPEVIPAAPTNLNAVVMSTTQTRLSWTDHSGGTGQFRISRRSGTGAMAVIGTVPAGTTLYVEGGLSADTDYTYSVKAFSTGGESAATNEATVRIPTGGVLKVSARVNFGSVKIGRVKTKTLKITNKGKGTLAGWVDAGGVTAPFRVIDGAGAFTLAPKKSKTLRLELNPTAKASSTALLKITSTDPKKVTVNVTLTGKGK